MNIVLTLETGIYKEEDAEERILKTLIRGLFDVGFNSKQISKNPEEYIRDMLKNKRRSAKELLEWFDKSKKSRRISKKRRQRMEAVLLRIEEQIKAEGAKNP